MRKGTTGLETRWEKVAAIFARTKGVTVKLQGRQPKTDGSTIYLPENANEMSAKDQRRLEGVLDHEWMHIHEEREAEKYGYKGAFKLLKEEVKNNREAMMLNVFEDIRCEEKATKLWIGVAENLALAMEQSVEEYQKEAARIEKSVGEQFWKLIGSAIIFKARGEELSWLPKALGPFVADLEPEIAESRIIERPEQSLELGRRVIEKLQGALEEARKEAEKRQEEKEAGEGENEDGSEGSSEGEEAEGEGEGSEAEGEEAENEDEGEKKGQGSKKGEGETDEEAENEGGNGGEKAEGEKKGQGSEAEGEGSESSINEMSDEELEEAIEALKGAERDAESQDMNDIEREKLGEKSEQEAAKTSGTRYSTHPAIERQDKVITPRNGDKSEYDRLRSKVNKQVGALKAKILQTLRSQAQSRFIGDREQGRIDSAALYGLRMGEKRVFCKRTEETKLDTAVSVLVDLSGSMGEGRNSRSKAYYAKMVSIALGETFNALNIPFEMVGFTNTYSRRRHAPDIDRYARQLPFDFHMFKSFGDKFTKVKARLTTITGLEENVDGGALMFVAKRLAVRRESRKMIFVISDGAPAGGCRPDVNHSYLHEVIRKVTKAGIEVFGIGVLTSSVARYYTPANGSSHIVVNKLDQFAVQVFKLLKAQLLKKRRAA